MTPAPVFFSVNGNAVIPQQEALLSTAHHSSAGAFGWGREFVIGTNPTGAGREDLLDRPFIFHFAPSLPTGVPDRSSPSGFARAQVRLVGIQGVFTHCRVAWIDLWDRNSRFFTTTEENSAGHRVLAEQLFLQGDLTSTWNTGDPFSGFDRNHDNVLAFPAVRQTTLFGPLGVSVGVIPEGSVATGSPSGTVLFTQLGVELGYVSA